MYVYVSGHSILAMVFFVLTLIVYSIYIGIHISKRTESRWIQSTLSLSSTILLLSFIFTSRPPTTSVIELAPKEELVDSFAVGYKTRCVIKNDDGSYLFRDLVVPQGKTLEVRKSVTATE
jgi:hypothetical protein